MTIVLLIALFIGLLLLWPRLAGFEAQSPARYADTTPAVDLRTHLNGPIRSEGVIYGPAGHVVSRFVADMNGQWNNHGGTLSEDFTYASGFTMQRKWTFEFGEDGRFTGTAPDIVGQAIGEVSGATIRMTYRIRLPEESGGYVLNVTDWLYLTENGHFMNRAVMRKFGIKVAELIATMRPVSAEAS